MGSIKLLDRELSNMIAAGEVVERPASVVKELVENSIDAGSENITVEIKNGGKTYIRVTDDGVGMNLVDARKAFLCHATSKISNKDDLFNIKTMGFRGEAIPAIASVSKVELYTVTYPEEFGNRLYFEAGVELTQEEMGVAPGTTFIVRDLFYNVPARLKFLKKDSTEASNIISLMNKFAIGNPDISFQLIVDEKLTLSTSKDSKLLDIIYSVYGKDITDNLLKIGTSDFGTTVEGYVAKPVCNRSNRNLQLFYVNGRIVKSKTIVAALDRAYHNRMMTGKYPVAIIKITVPTNEIDVNVHPTKTEVRFTNEQRIFDSVYYSVTSALNGENTFDEKESEHSVISADESFEKSTDAFYKEIFNMTENFPACDISNFGNDNSSSTTKIETIDLRDSGLKLEDLFTRPDGYAELPVFNDLAKVDEYPELYSRFSRVPSSDLSTEYYLDSQGQEMSFFPDEMGFTYIGELFKTYIIVESGNSFYLIDKHAAHERILFNKIEKSYKESKRYSQTLITGIPVTLTPIENDIAWENRDKLSAMGFEFDEFGKNEVVLRTVPYVMSDGDTVPTFIELIDVLAKNKDIDITEFENKTIKMLSCKAAIKAGYDTPEAELKKFAENLIKTGDVNYCPHGRPIICRFTKSDLEKSFKRIV